MSTDFTVNNGYWCIYCNYERLQPMMEALGLDLTDTAIGMAWAKHWCENDLESKYGDRCTVEGALGWQYPEAALPEFLTWFAEHLQEIKNRPKGTAIPRVPVLPTENLKPQNCYTGKTIFWPGFCDEDKKDRLPKILSACGILAGKSVCKSIDFLITGPHNGVTGRFANKGKQAQARELGIPIVPTETFIANVSQE